MLQHLRWRMFRAALIVALSFSWQAAGVLAQERAGVEGVWSTAEEWLAEGANAGVLRRLGWTGDELKPGDRIIVTGAAARDGSPKVEWRTLARADGTQLGGGNGLPQERDELLQRLEERRRRERSSGAK